jgi:RNA recognition motif-containing protein
VKLFISNVNYDAKDEDLDAFFEMAGFSPNSVKVITDKDSGRSRGFAFVEIDSASDGMRAVRELDQKEFMGRKLNVQESRPDPRESRGNRDRAVRERVRE